MKHRERSYRNRVSNDILKSFHVSVRETDLFVLADSDLTQHTFNLIFKYRSIIEYYIKFRNEFLTSLKPITKDENAPPIVKDMLSASRSAGVGPMAAVAGAIAEYVGKDLLEFSRNVIIENGGDIFLSSENDVKVAVYAGDSPLSYHVNILGRKEKMPMGICTSSGTVGHSLSFGRADAVCVVSQSAIIADASATAIGNLVKRKSDIAFALKRGLNIEGVRGVLIIMGEKFGAAGEIELL